jgi:hypothetical protein
MLVSPILTADSREGMGLMATVIKASCSECGDVELSTAEMMVRVCTQVDQASYIFRCPSCQMSVAKQAERRIVDLLVASGVRLERWDLPQEMFEQKLGSPICHDDLIDFHRLLQADDWFDDLLTNER